jgi:hypothetical protein
MGKRTAHEALGPAHLPRANRGQASRRRVRVGRPSASLEAWREIRAQILAPRLAGLQARRREQESGPGGEMTRVAARPFVKKRRPKKEVGATSI